MSFTVIVPAHDVGRPAVAPLPQPVADDGDAYALVVLLFREHPTEERAHTEHAPEVSARFACRDLLGLAVAGERRGSRLGESDVGEHRVVAPPRQPLGRGGKALPALAVQVVPDHDEPVGIGVRQRADQHRVEGAEDRRHSADAECQRGDGDQREPPVPTHLPQSVADVTSDLLQARPAPGGAGALRHESQVAQLAARRPSGLGLRHAVGSTLVGVFRQVKLKLLAQLGFLVGALDEPAQPAQEGVHRPS
jgi:hypothetical protein